MAGASKLRGSAMCNGPRVVMAVARRGQLIRSGMTIAAAVACAVSAGVPAVASADRPAGRTAALASCEGWKLSRPPSPGTWNTLLSVAVTPSRRVWAVGEYVNAQQGESDVIVRWTGSAWQQVPSPNPEPLTQANELRGVVATSARDTWAVGDYGLSTGMDAKTLIAQWRNGAWTQVPSPSPGSEYNYLLGVTAVAPASAWAVGTYASGAQELTLILRLVGGAWQQVPSPSPGEVDLLKGVAATSPANAWAVGYTSAFGAGYERTLIEHWNGRVWRRVPSPNVAGGTQDNYVAAVAAVSSKDAWAVADTAKDGPGHQSFIVHWNGIRWTRVRSPNPDRFDTVLNSLVVVSPASIWAVGSSNGVSLTLHWDGHAWRRVPSPSAGVGTDWLGVAVSSTASIWAVGSGSGGSGTRGTLALHRCP
jgi:hypothetical protein